MSTATLRAVTSPSRAEHPKPEAGTARLGLVPPPTPGAPAAPTRQVPPKERSGPRRLSLLPRPEPTHASVPAGALRAVHGCARAIVEALAGLRPAVHLARSCDLITYEKIRRRARWEHEARTQRQGSGTAPRQVLGLLGCHAQVVPGGIEASTTFAVSGSVRALAFRLEEHRQRWRVVAVEIG